MTKTKAEILGRSEAGHLTALATHLTKEKFATLTMQLARIGTRLTKADLANNKGPLGQLITMHKKNSASRAAPMINVDLIMAELQRHGETCTAAEWLQTKNMAGENALEFATRCKLLAKVFALESLAQNTTEMNLLWQQVPQQERKQVKNFPQRLAMAEQLGRLVYSVHPAITRAELIEINPILGFAPLQHARTWEQWPDIIRTLRHQETTHIAQQWQQSARGLTGATTEPDNPYRLRKADFLKSGSGKKSLLQMAIETHNMPTLHSYLVENGETLTQQDFIEAKLDKLLQEMNTKLYDAAAAGNDQAVLNLVATRIPDLNAFNVNTCLTPLMAAAETSSDIVATLLEYGADPDCRFMGSPPTTDGTCASPLWFACRYGNAETVEHMIVALDKKYPDDPLKLMDAFITRSIRDEHITTLQVAKKTGRQGVEKTFQYALDVVSGWVLALPIAAITAPSPDRRTGLELLVDAQKLPALFARERWYGNPQGLHQLAGTIAPEAIAEQCTGQNCVPTYATILSQANASVLHQSCRPLRNPLRQPSP